MKNLKPLLTISDWQNFCQEVYGLNNDRDFGVMEMLTNIQRFVMRSLKGIRKRDDKKTTQNILIAMSWYISLMNQLHIDIETKIWQRFPYLCLYCGSKPCSCKTKKKASRLKVSENSKIKPKSLKEFQEMFGEIYPPESRNLENAGIHLAEETGELSEAISTYRGDHKSNDFILVEEEAADLFSCFMSVANSLHLDVAKEIAKMFSKNCHVCHKLPCECDFIFVMNYKS